MRRYDAHVRCVCDILAVHGPCDAHTEAPPEVDKRMEEFGGRLLQARIGGGCGMVMEEVPSFAIHLMYDIMHAMM